MPSILEREHAAGGTEDGQIRNGPPQHEERNLRAGLNRARGLGSSVTEDGSA